MIYLTDRQLMVLLGVRDGKSYEEMAAKNYCDVSNMTIWKEVKFLRELGLVENVRNANGKTKVRGRKLTSLGERALRDNGHNINRTQNSTISNSTVCA